MLKVFLDDRLHTALLLSSGTLATSSGQNWEKASAMVTLHFSDL